MGPPTLLGGRNDTMYILWYRVAGSNQEVNPVREEPTVSTTLGTIAGKHRLIMLATNTTITMMTTGGGEGGEDAITKEDVFLFETPFIALT